MDVLDNKEIELISKLLNFDKKSIFNKENGIDDFFNYLSSLTTEKINSDSSMMYIQNCLNQIKHLRGKYFNYVYLNKLNEVKDKFNINENFSDNIDIFSFLTYFTNINKENILKLNKTLKLKSHNENIKLNNKNLLIGESGDNLEKTIKAHELGFKIFKTFPPNENNLIKHLIESEIKDKSIKLNFILEYLKDYEINLEKIKFSRGKNIFEYIANSFEIDIIDVLLSHGLDFELKNTYINNVITQILEDEIKFISHEDYSLHDKELLIEKVNLLAKYGMDISYRFTRNKDSEISPLFINLYDALPLEEIKQIRNRNKINTGNCFYYLLNKSLKACKKTENIIVDSADSNGKIIPLMFIYMDNAFVFAKEMEIKEQDKIEIINDLINDNINSPNMPTFIEIINPQKAIIEKNIINNEIDNNNLNTIKNIKRL